MVPFLSFLKSHKTYSSRTLSFISRRQRTNVLHDTLCNVAAFICLFGALLIYEAVTYARVCRTWPGNRLSARRNTQGNNLFVNDCQERPIYRLVNVTYTCDRKKTKPYLLGNIISISEDPERSKHLRQQIILFSWGVNHPTQQIWVSTKYHWFATSALHVYDYNLSLSR